MSTVTAPPFLIYALPDGEDDGPPDREPRFVVVPRGIDSLPAFSAWADSDAFPEEGRIDWIDGTLEVDMAPEDLHTHGAPKVEIAAALHQLVTRAGRGVVYVDSTRVRTPEANLSAEPDVVVVLFRSLESGRVRLGKRSGGRAGCIDLEGAPDIVVECVSRSSRRKDRATLREAYARAGIPEYWIADALSGAVSLEVLRLGEGGYAPAPASPEGYARSEVLGRGVRLTALPAHLGVVRYQLEVSE